MTTPGQEPAPIGLATAIEYLRKELSDAQDAGIGQRLKFTITEAQIELLLELREEHTGQAKGNLFSVVTIGGSDKNATANTHRLTLKFTVGDQSTGRTAAEITGQRQPPTPDHPQP